MNDIVARVDIHQSGVSRHLRILQEAGFVQVRPEGPKRLYSLCPEPFRELDTWVTGIAVSGRPASTGSARSSSATASAQKEKNSWR